MKSVRSLSVHRPLSSLKRAYTVAIARDLPDSFADALVEHSADPSPVSVEVARAQHVAYLKSMRRKLPTISLPASREHPDSCFVEDTVVAIADRAVLTHPGHESRRGEVKAMGKILEQLGMQVFDMKSLNPNAFCDGGDVLWTGRHLFVGLSARTNSLGADILQQCHNDVLKYPVKQVNSESLQQGGESLHLKSVVTHLDAHTLVAPTGRVGDSFLELMEADRLGYQAVRLPQVLACNLVVVNGTILAQASSCLESRQVLQQAAEERHLSLEFVDTSELAKKDGALTCCSVLLEV